MDGKLQPLEAGVAVIAAHEKAPILPVYIKGSFDAMPPGAKFIKPSKIKIIFGKPLVYAEEVYKKREGRDVIMKGLESAFRDLERE